MEQKYIKDLNGKKLFLKQKYVLNFQIAVGILKKGDQEMVIFWGKLRFATDFFVAV